MYKSTNEFPICNQFEFVMRFNARIYYPFFNLQMILHVLLGFLMTLTNKHFFRVYKLSNFDAQLE